MKEENIDNVYALNEKGEEVFVKEVDSGLNGYYCMGCKRSMMAVHSVIDGRKWYFRHYVEKDSEHPKCTYSDKDYRHKLAQLALLSLKKIKVPAVYKYPSDGEQGGANLLFEARFIEGYFAEKEISFFEDQNGHIQESRSLNIEGNLLIRADVVLYDIKRKPVLLVELVLTHKLDLEKKLKLKRLGLDTIQVTVPKDSPEEIQKAFFTTKYTKWIFNHEQENTEYIPISHTPDNGISSFDEDQRKFFEETVRCRSAQIGNLIFAINKCLESEQYRGIKQNLNESISAVEINTEREREGLGDIQAAKEAEAKAELSGEYAKVESEGNRIREAEERFREKENILGKRYLEKKSELLNKTIEIKQHIDDEQSRFSARTSIESIEQLINGERKSIRDTSAAIAGIEGKIGNFDQQGEELERKYEGLINDKETDIDGLIIATSRDIEKIQHDIEGLPTGYREIKTTEQRGFEREERELVQQFERFRKGIEHKFNTRPEQVFRDMEKGEAGQHYALSEEFLERINEVLILSTIGETRRIFKRYESARKAIREGTYKNWHD